MTANTINLTARSLKCTLVLDPTGLAGITVPDGAPRVTLKVTVDGRTISASIAAKSVRKAVQTIADNGADNVALVLQGKLVAATVEEGGLSVVPKVKPQAQAEAA